MPTTSLIGTPKGAPRLVIATDQEPTLRGGRVETVIGGIVSDSELWAIEKEALLDLCLQHADFRQDDTWHAAVGELREDGASVCKPLTLARLDAWASATWEGRLSPNFSMRPES